MDALGLAKVFVKTVVRMFYETEHIVVIDALTYHGAMPLADIVLVLDIGKNQKNAQKLIGKLREGGLISVYTRAEQRDGAMKAVNREYFYIDYRRAIDATKYKIHVLDERIKKDAAPTQEKKELSCPQCKAQWTTMEVLDNVDYAGRASGFLCKTCSHPLNEIAPDGDDAGNDDTPAKFNKNFAPLLKLMQQIDEVIIPAIEGEDAVKEENMIPLPRDKEVNPAAKHEVVTEATVRPTAVRGVATGPEKIDVTIATSSEYTEAERAAEQRRQAKIAAQNALPEWHTKSTVRDSGTTGDANEFKSETNGVSTPSIKAEAGERKDDKETALDDVFAKLEAERRKEEEKEQQESEEEEDDEEDFEFEDVVVTTSTPTEGPDAKRLKVESSAAPSPAMGATPATSTGDGADESEEDADFEDVVKIA
jgi:transcription initiation factor TFIIE subunit alpha